MSTVRLYEDQNEIDLTPMLDVVFIMLIFFIVSATYIREVGIGLVMPENRINIDAQSTPIIIKLQANGHIEIDHTATNINALQQTIIRIQAAKPDATVKIESAGDAKTAWLVQIMDQLHQADIHNFSVTETASQ